jgi:hypothetical protein
MNLGSSPSRFFFAGSSLSFSPCRGAPLLAGNPSPNSSCSITTHSGALPQENPRQIVPAGSEEGLRGHRDGQQ